MIESPLLREIESKARRKSLLLILGARFGPIPPDVPACLAAIEDEVAFDRLIRLAALCPDLDAFRAGLSD